MNRPESKMVDSRQISNIGGQQLLVPACPGQSFSTIRVPFNYRSFPDSETRHGHVFGGRIFRPLLAGHHGVSQDMHSADMPT